jgi:hypothetical protein
MICFLFDNIFFKWPQKCAFRIRINKEYCIYESGTLVKSVMEFINLQENPFPGVIRNTVGGENVYKNVVIDYSSEEERYYSAFS